MAKYGQRMLPSHRKAIRDITVCRTETLGGQVFRCQRCERYDYSYHSCCNRHCPKCQNHKATEWLAAHTAVLLPVLHFLVTVTLPQALRPVARRNQNLIYGLMFRCAAEAIQKLARDPKFIGGEVGILAILQTWSRDLRYHPHVHFVVPGGGVSPDGQTWLPVQRDYLMPAKALGRIFRAKFRDALKASDAQLFATVPGEVWRQDWVIDIRAVGKGRRVLKYLAPYVFRVAISNKRILRLKDGQVTFQYKASDRRHFETATVTAEEFIRRFLQHVLPRHFVKVRYYGFFSPRKQALLEAIKKLFERVAEKENYAEGHPLTESLHARRCPKCGAIMVWVRHIQPVKKRLFGWPYCITFPRAGPQQARAP